MDNNIEQCENDYKTKTIQANCDMIVNAHLEIITTLSFGGSTEEKIKKHIELIETLSKILTELNDVEKIYGLEIIDG